jgi:hypothetical protein
MLLAVIDVPEPGESCREDEKRKCQPVNRAPHSFLGIDMFVHQLQLQIFAKDQPMFLTPMQVLLRQVGLIAHKLRRRSHLVVEKFEIRHIRLMNQRIGLKRRRISDICVFAQSRRHLGRII